jgi:hypothetical protein
MHGVTVSFVERSEVTRSFLMGFTETAFTRTSRRVTNFLKTKQRLGLSLCAESRTAPRALLFTSPHFFC